MVLPLPADTSAYALDANYRDIVTGAKSAEITAYPLFGFRFLRLSPSRSALRYPPIAG